MEQITFDENGNCIGSNFIDYLLPTAWETPHFELVRDGDAVAAPPDRSQGRGRVGNRGSPAAYVNAVIDALQPLGVKNIDMPLTSAKVWQAIQDAQGTA